MYHPTNPYRTSPLPKPTLILHFKINRDRLAALSHTTSPRNPAIYTTATRILHPNPSPVQCSENKTSNCKLRARHVPIGRPNGVIIPTKRSAQALTPTKHANQALTPTKRLNQATTPTKGLDQTLTPTKSLNHKQALVIFERSTDTGDGKSRNRRTGCGLFGCRVCGPFLRMYNLFFGS